MKALIFDSSSIITFALNNLLNLLPKLKEEFKGEFFITDEIKQEIIDTPLKIKRFELEALMISKLLENKTITISKINIKQEIKKIIDTTNSIFKAHGEYIKIIHEGEASCLALYKKLKEQGHNVTLVIDERTARMLCEAPLNLHKLFEKKLHTNVKFDKEKLPYFRDFSIIRSSELCFIAFKRKLITLPAEPQRALDALLYATKYKGCAISIAEIEKIKRMPELLE